MCQYTTPHVTWSILEFILSKATINVFASWWCIRYTQHDGSAWVPSCSYPEQDKRTTLFQGLKHSGIGNPVPLEECSDIKNTKQRCLGFLFNRGLILRPLLEKRLQVQRWSEPHCFVRRDFHFFLSLWVDTILCSYLWYSERSKACELCSFSFT